MTDLLIGIDAGTSVIKTVAFDLQGRQQAISAKRNVYQAVSGGGVEQEMERTWTDTLEVLRDLVKQVSEHTIVGLAVTGQGDGTWLMAAEGQSVAPAWLWLDARAADWVEAYADRDIARQRFELTGTGLAACQQGPQLAWLRDHAPDVLAKTSTAFHCKDWLYYHLTGQRATDPSEGVFTFGNYRERGYSEEVVDLLGLSPYRSLLPPLVEGTQESHPLLPLVAEHCGLPAGLPVILGYVDVICTALGSGLYDPGCRTGCTIIGSTGMHMRLANSVEEVSLNAESTGYTMLFPVPGTYSQMQSNLAATLNIDWMLDLALGVLSSQGVGKQRSDLLQDLDERLLKLPPAEVLYHPYISQAGERGPFINAHARASFLGLNTNHGFFEMLRGVYEGLAFAARDCYEAAGGVPEEVRLSGGAARSRALRNIMGAALKTRLRTAERGEAGAAGVAMMAAVCLGIYPDMATCVEDWVRPYLSEPEGYDEAQAEVYDSLYPIYRQTRHVLEPVWKSMKQLKETDGT